MKLLRYGGRQEERPGLLDGEGRIRDLSGLLPDLAGAHLSPESLARIAAVNPNTLPVVDGEPRIGACVGAVGKLIGIGLNYADHADEAGMPRPTEPIVFLKATSAINGPFDALEIPPDSRKTDWEVELGVVIGRPGKHIDPAQARAHIAGYCVANDVSEREWQLERGGQWVKGKSADTFAPLGPYLVTVDEIADPQNLRLWLELDGRMRQNGTTANMIFPVAEIIAYLSRCMSLQAGDVILTGTPPGVGMGCKPPEFLRPGMRLRLGIEGLGEQSMAVVQGD